MQPSHNPNLCWLAVDTTGLEPDADLIGVCVVRENVPSYVRFRSNKPACEANGYDPKTWGGYPQDGTMFPTYCMYLDEAILAGHNLHFHYGKLREVAQRFGVSLPYNNFAQRVDLMHVFAPAVAEGVVSGVALPTLCRELDINIPNNGAAAQCLRAMALYDQYVDAMFGG